MTTRHKQRTETSSHRTRWQPVPLNRSWCAFMGTRPVVVRNWFRPMKAVETKCLMTVRPRKSPSVRRIIFFYITTAYTLNVPLKIINTRERRNKLLLWLRRVSFFRQTASNIDDVVILLGGKCHSVYLLIYVFLLFSRILL